MDVDAGHTEVAKSENAGRDRAGKQDDPSNSDNETPRATATLDATARMQDADNVRIDEPPADKEETLEEYDPPLNPDWRISFRNRETIFDNRPRRSKPRRCIFDAIAEDSRVRDGWKAEWNLHYRINKDYWPGLIKPRKIVLSERCMKYARERYMEWKRAVEADEEEAREWEREVRAWEEEWEMIV